MNYLNNKSSYVFWSSQHSNIKLCQCEQSVFNMCTDRCDKRCAFLMTIVYTQTFIGHDLRKISIGVFKFKLTYQ